MHKQQALVGDICQRAAMRGPLRKRCRVLHVHSSSWMVQACRRGAGPCQVCAVVAGELRSGWKGSLACCDPVCPAGMLLTSQVGDLNSWMVALPRIQAGSMLCMLPSILQAPIGSFSRHVCGCCLCHHFGGYLVVKSTCAGRIRQCYACLEGGAFRLWILGCGVCAAGASDTPPQYLHTSRSTALRLRSHEVCLLSSAAGGAWAVAGPHVHEPRSAALASCCGECQWTKGGGASLARILRCSRKRICVGRGCRCLLGCLCHAPHQVQCEHNMGALGVPIHV